MITRIEIPRDDKGNITVDASTYKPSDAVKDRTAMVMKHFSISDAIMMRPYKEFNDMSLMQRMDHDQKAFNTYQPPRSEDPDEYWKSNAVRPITRNKVISIAAHVVGAMLYPQIFAQNEHDKEDKDAAIVMRSIMEWVADHSDYAWTFLKMTIAGLVNPACIVETGYFESYCKSREKVNGEWKEEIVLDDVFSGFQDSVVPLDEMFISDIYENNIQKQEYLIRRRAPLFSSLEAKYGDNPKFRAHCRPGIQAKFDENTGGFYDMYDDNLRDVLGEEVIYYNRREDLRLTFVNGILFDDPDEPNPRQDKRYPFAKSGYELFDEGKFFYYKSLVNKIGPDKDIIDRLYRYVIDGSFIKLLPPVAVFGKEEINSSVVTPGQTTVLGKDSKLEIIDVGGDMVAGERALDRVESSVVESSQDPRGSGQRDTGQQTKFEVGVLEQNARTLLGLFGKMIGFMVNDFGYLRISDILQFMTIGEVMETTGEASRMKFRNFLIPDQTVEGKKVTRKIVFDHELPENISKKDEDKLKYKLLKEEGGMDAKTRMYLVNPTLYRRIKFLLRIQADAMSFRSDNVNRLLGLEWYDRAINNPMANQEATYRELLNIYPHTKEDPDKYIAEGSQGLASLVGASPNQQTKSLTGAKVPEREL